MKNKLFLTLVTLMFTLITFSDVQAQSAEENDGPTKQEILQAQLDKEEAAEQEKEQQMNAALDKKIADFDKERKKADQEIITRANASQTDHSTPASTQPSSTEKTQIATPNLATKKKKGKSKKKKN